MPARLSSCTIMIAAVVLSPALPSAAAQGQEAPPDPPDAAAARMAFERFARLAGTWRGRSTKGWTEQITYRMIAGGSVVMSTSFDAHPNETMVTMVHLDGDRLLLTHYCVARNQPRLLLRAVEAGGKRLRFEYLDGTNLPSRDKGHMDSAVFEFHDDGRFNSRWSWYQAGSERWMETIESERIAPADFR